LLESLPVKIWQKRCGARARIVDEYGYITCAHIVRVDIVEREVVDGLQLVAHPRCADGDRDAGVGVKKVTGAQIAGVHPTPLVSYPDGVVGGSGYGDCPGAGRTVRVDREVDQVL
jgi:hypothetical protein